MTQAASWPIPHTAEPPAEAPPLDLTEPGVDREAFAAQYRLHFPAVAGYLYRRTGDQSLAEDLAADTFLAAWKALPRYRTTQVPFQAWLFRIATNKANAVARRERTRRRILALLAPRTGHPTRSAQTDLLVQALARLSPAHQTVIGLVYLEEFSVEQAARVLDIPEGTVKSRLLRARDALKRELARTGDAA
jgi:RNA polymerase sigma-70 factor (ECF subfamily)